MRSREAGRHAGTSRRDFAGWLALAIVAVRAAPAAAARTARAQQAVQPAPELAPSHASPATPVVSFFLDQPYLDLTGRDTPYVPPRGLRSAQLPAELGELVLRGVIGWR